MNTGRDCDPRLARCLQLNALALAFSLAHAMADYGIIFAMTGFNTWGMAAYLGMSSAVYGWWGWSMARAAAGPPRSRCPACLRCPGSGRSCTALTFVFIPITNILADVIHFGSLIFGVWAAYATWRVLRGSRVVVAQAH